jgi:hypothetical protein
MEFVSDKKTAEYFLEKNIWWMPGANIFRFCTKKLRADKDLALKAISAGAYALMHFDNNLRNDNQFLKKCININPFIIRFIETSDDLDLNVMTELLNFKT